MNPRPSFFLIQTVFVLLVALFHMAAARLAYRRIPAESRRWRRFAAFAFAVLILVLDIPLAQMFILYKDFHPLLVDNLMHDWAAPFLALQANAFLFGGAILAWQYLIRPAGRLAVRLARATGLRPRKADVADTTATVGGTTAVAATSSPAADGVRAVPVLNGAPMLYLPRRRFLYGAGMAVAGYAAGASTLKAMDTTGEYRLEKVVLKVPNLPEGLKGTTIALISDIHSSVFMMREDMDRYVKALNGMKADLALVVGDFVNSKLREVYPFAESFSALKAPLGVFGVTGNHDYYTGEIENVVKEVQQCGIRLLRNENLAIEKNGEKLWLLGVDDSDIYDVKQYIENGKTQRGTTENLLRGIPDGAPKLFLCHKPYPFEEYSSLGLDVMLSGHTHGGQVVIAQLDNINLSFATLASRYVAGLYQSRSNRNAQLYVSRGVGTVGLPIRLNCPPEVTYIVLV